MRSLIFILLIALLATQIKGNPQNATPLKQLKNIEVAKMVSIEGAKLALGCPESESSCIKHCKNIGYKSGYCGGFLWMTCYCTK